MISNLPTRIFRASRRPNQARRGRRRFIGAEGLESRVLLSGINGSDIAGTWIFSGSARSGTIGFNDSNGITGGSLTDSAGNTTTPAGSYALASDGTLSMDLNSAGELGAMNGRHDVIAITQTNSINSLAVLVNSGNAAFSDADLKGTWTIAFANNADTHSGGGIVDFDGKGAITGGSLSTGAGMSTVTGGNYTVATDGTCTVTIKIKTGSATPSFSFTGAINASDDVLSMSNTNLDTANQTGKPNLVFLVKSSGAYSKASLIGDWTFNAELGVGTLVFSGGGSITGGTFTDYQGNLITIMSGNYTMSSNGAMLVFIQYNDNGTVTGAYFRGAMNAANNVMNGYSDFDTPFGNVAAFVSAGDHAPTLTSEKPFATAVGNSPFDITYAQLASNAVGLNDIDNDTLSFQIDSGAVGATLSLNGVPQNSFPFVVGPGDTLSFTAAANASGKIKAFTLNAFDGTLASATAVPVTITTIPEPTVSVTVSAPTADEVRKGEKGIGGVTFTRTGSTAVALTVDYTVSGAANDGSNYDALPLSVVIPEGKSSVAVQIIPTDNLTRGGTSVALNLAASGTDYNLGAKTSGTVTIVDNNFAPLSIAGMSLSGKITTGVAPFPGSGTYQLFFAATSSQYLFYGGPTIEATRGTFTYDRTSATTAEVTLTGNSGGTSDGTITFTSASLAGFTFAQESGSGSQTSKVTLVAAPKTNFAPDSPSGYVDTHKITAGSGLLPASGTDQVIFSQSANFFVVAGNGAVPSGVDDFSYEKFGPDISIVSFSNNQSHNGFTAVVYSSATKATYETTLENGEGNQHGTTAVKAPAGVTIAPVSLSGKTDHEAITGGTPPTLPSKGTATVVFNASTYSFNQTSPITIPLPSSTGTYTYQLLTPSIAFVSLDDSSLGASFEVLEFTSATKAGYLLVQDSTLNWQRGAATLS